MNRNWLRLAPCNPAIFPSVRFRAMQRTLLAFYDDCRRELEVRRPSGQVFRFRLPQIGTYQVFAIEPQPDLDEIWVWTGTHGSRRQVFDGNAAVALVSPTAARRSVGFGTGVRNARVARKPRVCTGQISFPPKPTRGKSSN